MRVLVTRPRLEGEALAATLGAGGHDAVLAPVLVIVPLPVLLPAVRPDAVLATSPQAVAALADAVLDELKGLPLYVVGTASASVARRRGFGDVRIGAGDGVALVEAVVLTCPRGARLLYLAGRVHKAELALALTARGYSVTTIESYDAAPVADWATTVPVAPGGRPFDACLHFSRRSAELSLAGSRNSALREAFDGAQHHCLSADVAEPLRAAGLPHIIVARQPTTDSLLQGLTATLPHGPEFA